jgi:hypothetical protein
MIISQEMEGPVENQLGNFTDLVVAQGLCLPLGGIERDDDLAQQSETGRQFIAIRKRQHVGRMVFPTIPPVELANPFITGDQDVDLGGLDVEPIQTA